MATAAAPATPEAPEVAGKACTRQALDAEARALCERRKLAHDAARWVREQERLKHICDDTKKLTYNMVEPLLRQLKKSGKFEGGDRDHHNQILTNTE